MKKSSLLLPLLALLLWILPASAAAADTGRIVFTAGEKEITVSGSVYKFDAPSVIQRGRFYVPVSALSRAIGAVAAWNNKTRCATMMLNRSSRRYTVKMGADSNLITLTNSPGGGISAQFVTARKIDMEAPVLLLNGRLMIPLRPLAEALGYKVIWQPQSNSVELITDI